jgi:hypothetical protein
MSSQSGGGGSDQSRSARTSSSNRLASRSTQGSATPTPSIAESARERYQSAVPTQERQSTPVRDRPTSSASRRSVSADSPRRTQPEDEEDDNEPSPSPAPTSEAVPIQLSFTSSGVPDDIDAMEASFNRSATWLTQAADDPNFDPEEWNLTEFADSVAKLAYALRLREWGTARTSETYQQLPLTDVLGIAFTSAPLEDATVRGGPPARRSVNPPVQVDKGGDVVMHERTPAPTGPPRASSPPCFTAKQKGKGTTRIEPQEQPKKPVISFQRPSGPPPPINRATKP